MEHHVILNHITVAPIVSKHNDNNCDKQLNEADGGQSGEWSQRWF